MDRSGLEPTVAADTAIPSCGVCGLAVGAYEPAVFVHGDEVVHSSRAAGPSLSGRAGTRLLHRDCFSAQDAGARLHVVA